MGFYGNITNTSNTTFSFDKIYPNRLAMDANANNDGVFIGRYVLVEYQEEAAYPVAYHATETSEDSGQYYFYSSTNQEEISKIKYLGLPPGEPDRLPSVDDVNAIYQDGFYKGEILQRYIYSSDKKDWIFSEEFYVCVGEDDKHFAIFELIADPSMKSHYIQNFEIDEKHYGQDSKGFKGYDSTVWMKSSVTASDGKLITKYVNIADLNSVVPTFDIAADAPTMEPLTPHFDADSTNVYYKLHAQAPYGFRVKAETNKKLSDEKTKHYKVTYDKDRNITISDPTNPDAAIYYNKEAFRAKPYIDEITGKIIPVVKKDITTINEIKIQPSGYTDNYANKYSHKPTSDDRDLVGDIQEFSLHLPAIGNMMSDAWDIIHGPNRDDDMREFDADGKNVSSLKGRLDSIDALEDDTIPVKRDADGKLVGNKLNGGKTSTTDYTGKDDDEWIETLVNGNEEKITIHHTYDLEDKNKYKDIGHLEESLNINNDTSNKIDLNNGTNTLDINTPIVDSMGHVVGRNIETVTLPYGYKTIKVTNTGDDAILNAAQVVNPDGQIADNTQDELTLSASNRWIKLDNNSEDTIKFGHQVNPIEEKDKDLTDLNDGTDTITIQDTIYDEAGHVTANQKHTYTLPYGYKTIEVVNDSTETIAPIQEGTVGETADNTQDTLKFSATNKWIKMKATGDNIIEFGHEHSVLGAGLHNLNSQTPKFGQAFNIQTFTTDKAGHLVAKGTETVTIPHSIILDESSKNIMVDLTLNETEGEFTIHRENLGSLILNDYTTISGTRPNQIGAGDSLQAALGKIETTIENLDYTDSTSNTTQFVSKVTQSNGKIEVSRSNAGTLMLTGYTQGTNKDDISSADTINSAFAKLQNQITYEENRINTILTGENDLTGTLDTFIELQSYINEHGQEAADMAKAIEDEIARAKTAEEANQQAISDEAIRADLAEKALGTRIDNLDYEKTRVNNYYISSIKQTDGLVEVGTTLLPIRTVASGTTNGTILVNGSAINVGGLKSAAYTESTAYATASQGSTADTTAATIATYGDIVTHNHSEYATAAQGALADNALPKDTEFIYIEEFKDTETGEILIPEVKMTIEQLVKKVAELENEIKILKGE